MQQPAGMEQGSRRKNADPSHGSGPNETHGMASKKYAKFLGMLGVSLVAMYFLAFSQIERPAHFQWSLSVFSISLSMVSTMGMIMVGGMWNMLPSKRANILLVAVFALLLLGAFTAGRIEAGVADDAFLRSMIPHHSRAIHMCQEASLADPEVVELCDQIIQAQREEIAQMERIIERRD